MIGMRSRGGPVYLHHGWFRPSMHDTLDRNPENIKFYVAFPLVESSVVHLSILKSMYKLSTKDSAVRVYHRKHTAYPHT